MVHQVGAVTLEPETRQRWRRHSQGIKWTYEDLSTLTCSLDVTAQKTISVKPWVGNILKQMPPMTRPSLMRARVLCFLWTQRRSGQVAGLRAMSCINKQPPFLPLTDQTPVGWCTLWAYEVTGGKRRSEGRPATSGSSCWTSGRGSFRWRGTLWCPVSPPAWRSHLVQRWVSAN